MYENKMLWKFKAEVSIDVEIKKISRMISLERF